MIVLDALWVVLVVVSLVGLELPGLGLLTGQVVVVARAVVVVLPDPFPLVVLKLFPKPGATFVVELTLGWAVLPFMLIVIRLPFPFPVVLPYTPAGVVTPLLLSVHCKKKHET